MGEGSRQEFWGNYTSLNQHISPEKTIWSYQIQKIRALEIQNEKLQKANEILEIFSQVDGNKIQKDIVEQSTNQIYVKILGLLNSAFTTSPTSIKSKFLEKKEGTSKYTYKPEYTKEKYQKEKDDAVAQLKELLELIKYPNAERLTNIFSKAINGKNIKKISGFSSYTAYKAAEVEQLMMWALTSSNENWQGIVTGKFYNDKDGQLIQDIFIFPTEINIDEKFNYDIRTKKEERKGEFNQLKTISDFLKDVQKLNTNQKVTISDELYAKLKELSILRGQAKSGGNLQKILNNTKNRGSIKFEDLGEPMLEQIWALYEDKGKWIEADQEKAENSETLGCLANYALSKAIAQTSLMDNDIYFTRDGFITASKWMEIYKYMLKFEPAVNRFDGSSFMSQMRTYALKPVSS